MSSAWEDIFRPDYRVLTPSLVDKPIYLSKNLIMVKFFRYFCYFYNGWIV